MFRFIPRTKKLVSQEIAELKKLRRKLLEESNDAYDHQMFETAKSLQWQYHSYFNDLRDLENELEFA